MKESKNKKVKAILEGKKTLPLLSLRRYQGHGLRLVFSKLMNYLSNFSNKPWNYHFFIKQKLKYNRSLSKTKIALKKRSKPTFFSKHPLLTLLLKIIFFPIINPFIRYGLLLIFLSITIYLFYVIRDLPSPQRLISKENYAVSTQIFDRHGTLLYEIFGDEHRIPVKIDDLPEHLIQATVAIEDKNFFKHHGIDFEGVVRAVLNNLQGKPLEGGSTITQQLIKNALLNRERSYDRKVKEAILALMTEYIYTKQEILEMYLNYISYGGNVVGVEAAAEKFFDKHAKDLTLAEATILAGLPQAPSLYSPFSSDQRYKNRQFEVLRRMMEDKYITPLQAEEAKAEKIKLALSSQDIKAPHFVFYVRDWLYDKYGAELVEKGGLRVTTTLDLELQQSSQEMVTNEVKTLKKYRVSNGAAMITKPNTGEILAMVGSKDYFDNAIDGQVNVAISLRQPGSSIKPIMYATAFQEKLLNPGSVLLDVPTCFDAKYQQKPYCPKNYSGDFKGPITIRQALGNSINIPAVKSLQIIGLEQFIKQATKMGITTWTDPSRYGLALTLGGGEVKMIDMTQAFGVLANEGVKVPLTPVLKIEDYQGQVLYEIKPAERIKTLTELNQDESQLKENELERVMNRAPAYMVSHILQDNSARSMAFGTNSKLVIKGQIVSAKTGTTNNLKDNWTIGYTPEYLVMTWVGNSDGAPMSSITSGIIGAAPMFNSIMNHVLNNQPPVAPEKPSDVVIADVCASGVTPEMSGSACQTRYKEFYWKEGKPSRSTMITQTIFVRPETGLPPAPGEPTDNLVPQEKVIYSDPLTENYCSDCQRATNEQGKTIYERYVISTQNTTKEEN